MQINKNQQFKITGLRIPKDSGGDTIISSVETAENAEKALAKAVLAYTKQQGHDYAKWKKVNDDRAYTGDLSVNPYDWKAEVFKIENKRRANNGEPLMKSMDELDLSQYTRQDPEEKPDRPLKPKKGFKHFVGMKYGDGI